MKRRELLLASVGSASGPRLLPVRLFSQIANLERVDLVAPFTLAGETFPAGKWFLQANGRQIFLRGSGQPRRYQGAVVLQQARGIRFSPHEVRRYRGWIQIRAKPPLELINWVDLEEYLQSVVPGEMPPDWPQTALQAQAVVARTNAVPHLGSASDPLLDSTADQFYGGIAYETPATTAAVRATQGRILTHQKAPIAALFHSTCGGHTSANQDIFAPPARPYLQGVACDWCRDSPFYGPHQVRVLAAHLSGIFGSANIRILETDPYGRPKRLQVGSRLLSGQEFWLQLGQNFGWGLLPSNRYTLRLDGSGAEFTFRGAGHGVGLCQWGARGMAERTLAEILAHYYPGSVFSQT